MVDVEDWVGGTVDIKTTVELKVDEAEDEDVVREVIIEEESEVMLEGAEVVVGFWVFAKLDD